MSNEKRLGLQTVNCTFRLGDVSDNLKRFILENGREWTRHYFPSVQINSYQTKDLWNDSTELGLKMYRDYYLCVDLVYPGYDRNTGEVGYVGTEIGRFSKYGKKVNPVMDIEYNRVTTDWLEENNVNIEDLYDELTKLFKDDFHTVEDLDAEAIEEALECGDLDALEEIIGDRDLAEII